MKKLLVIMAAVAPFAAFADTNDIAVSFDGVKGAMATGGSSGLTVGLWAFGILCAITLGAAIIRKLRGR